MRISDRSRADFAFYERNARRFTFSGTAAPPVVSGTVGALEAFVAHESTGRMLPCADPATLAAVLQAKKAINWQIKQWAEGGSDTMLTVCEALESFDGPVPEWVERAVRGALYRRRDAR